MKKKQIAIIIVASILGAAVITLLVVIWSWIGGGGGYQEISKDETLTIAYPEGNALVIEPNHRYAGEGTV
jgi:hypothetical protein